MCYLFARFNICATSLLPYFGEDLEEYSSLLEFETLKQQWVTKDAALNLIDVNTRFDDAHIDLDWLKFVLFCVYTHV